MAMPTLGSLNFMAKGGLTRAAARHKSLHVQGLEVLDLRTTRQDGECWDFTRKADRQWALRLLRELQPMWVIAAPPCTAFSVLNHNLNYPKLPEQEVRRRVEEGMVHIKFVCKIYHFQLKHNRQFFARAPTQCKVMGDAAHQERAQEPQGPYRQMRPMPVWRRQ